LPHIFDRFTAHVAAALAALEAEGQLPGGIDTSGVSVEPPRDPAHGDLATNAAMVLSKRAGMRPRELATLLAQRLARLDGVESAEVAGPGFINLRLSASVWREELVAILAAGESYGRSTMGAGARVNVEYVSANPTGPLHMGHCRGAVLGDALASLLAYAGFEVTREYYINDAGGQVDVLARSGHIRYREALGQQVGEIPEGLYPGEYLKPVGEALARELKDSYADAPEATWLPVFRTKVVAAMMELIRRDLLRLGIEHDQFFSEASLAASGRVEAAQSVLAAKGLIYEGVLERPKGEASDDWEPREQTLFASTRFGDDSDRAVRKSDGSWTYFASDIAYHWDKIERGYDQLIDVLGADHGGYVKRMQAAVTALSDGRVPLDVKLCQMVRLFRAGEPVKMSKRSGSFITIAEVLDEVGRDVVRFMMLTRRPDAPLDFDFAHVVEQSKDNPVFYVQYAHARICSLERRAADAFGAALPDGLADRGLLGDAELALVKLAAEWPRVVEGAAAAHEAHRIAFYLGELAAAFHALWNRGNDDPRERFLVEGEPALSAARLALARAVRQVLSNGLRLMGVTPVDEMH
jgi:arginyl-tRNA synthetase